MSGNEKARRPYRKASEYAAKAPMYKQHQHISNQQQHVNNQQLEQNVSFHQHQQHVGNQQQHKQHIRSQQQQHAVNQHQHMSNQQQRVSNQQQQATNQQQRVSNQQQQQATNQQQHVPHPYSAPSSQPAIVKQNRSNFNPQHLTTNHASQEDLEIEIGVLRKKLTSLSNKLEHAECEFMQTREYLQNQIDLSNDRFQRMNEQYKKLQTSYTSLLSTNRQLEGKLSKVENLEREKSQMFKEVNELNSKLSDSRNALLKTQEENERLRKDCNLAVQLLKCNQGTYQAQKLSQLPDDVQDKISNFKMEIQEYNEYINPYRDSESDSESENQPRYIRNGALSGPGNNTNEEIPVELLAKVLKKTENVHLNLEDSDYINDPQLTSTYKGHYAERKLIKPDYDREKNANTQLSGENASGSPWAKAPTSTQSAESSSPWELAPSRPRAMPSAEDDDDSAAGAYGAYSVATKRRHHPPRTVNQKTYRAERNVLPPAPMKSDDDIRMLPRRSPSPDQLEFRAPLPPSSSQGVAAYFSRSASNKSSPSISSSSGSRKHSPLKVRGKEAAKKEEVSSLLNQEESDDEDAMNHVDIRNGPRRKYLLQDDAGDHFEDAGTLLRMTQDEDDDENPHEIDLEWDPTLQSPPTDLPEDEIKEEEIVVAKQGSTQAAPDLLLSYNNLEKPIDPRQSLTSDLEGLLISSQEPDEQDLRNNLSPEKDEIPLMGNLLTQIMSSKPSVENFLLSTPPPPQAFASSSNPLEEEIENSLSLVQKSDVLDLIDTDEDHLDEESGGCNVEVLDLEEEPRQRQASRRRESLDNAQEFGNVLDNGTNV